MTYFDKIVEKALMESMPSIEREQIKLFQKLDSLDENTSNYLEVNEQLQKLISKQKRTQQISVEGKWTNPTNPNEKPQLIRQALGTKIPTLAVNFWTTKGKHIVMPERELNCGDIMYASHDTNMAWNGIKRRGGKNGWNYLTQDFKPTPHPRNAVKNQARAIRERGNPSSFTDKSSGITDNIREANPSSISINHDNISRVSKSSEEVIE